MDREVSTIKGVAGDEDEFVACVLASVNPVALKRGVCTEDSLRERWCAVERVARRVAGIGEQGGSLLRSVMSSYYSQVTYDVILYC